MATYTKQTWADGPTGGTPLSSVRLQHFEDGLQTVADSLDGGTFTAALVPTAVKTSAYTAVVGDLVLVDTTSGAVTITLPISPVDKARIAVKLITQGAGNNVTIARGGSDYFNKVGGSTSLSLTTANQAMTLQYASAAGVWYVLSDSIAMAAITATYAPLASPALTGTPTVGGAQIEDRTHTAATYVPLSNATKPLPASNGTDDTAALQALLSSGGHFAARRGETYKVSNLVLVSNTYLDLGDATFNQIAGSSDGIFYYSQISGSTTPISNVTIRGGILNGESPIPSVSFGQGGIVIYQGRNIRVENVRLNNFFGKGISLIDCQDVWVIGNHLYNCCYIYGSGGANNAIDVSSGNYNTLSAFGDVFIKDNYVDTTQGAGIDCVMQAAQRSPFIIAPSAPIRAIITGNLVRNSLWAGVAVEANGFHRQAVVANNVILSCIQGVYASESSAVANRTTDPESLRGLVISGNVIDAEAVAGASGIQCTHSNSVVVGNSVRHTSYGFSGGGDGATTPNRRTHNMNVTGNVFVSANAGSVVNNVALGYADNCSFQNNHISTEVLAGSGAGIRGDSLKGWVISGNTITGVGRDGIFLVDAQNTAVANNNIIDPAASAGSYSGITVQGITGKGLLVVGNFINDTASRMVYGLNLLGITAGNIVRDRLNTILGYTTADVSNGTVANVTLAATNGTGDLTSGSPTVLNATGTYYPGMGITGTGISASTTVTAVSGTTLTLSANATATNTGVTLTNASPFVYRNLDGHDMDVIVQGGTVSTVEVARLTNGVFYNTGTVNGLYRVGPQDLIRVTASVSPTVRRVPRTG